MLEPESVEKRVQFLRENPEYQCVRSLAYYFDCETGAPRPYDEKQGDGGKRIEQCKSWSKTADTV